MREAGEDVPPKQLLGTVVEVALPEGIDTLAAYTDGSVRYINHSGRMVIAESVPSLAALVEALLSASQGVVDAIGPSDEPRRPPPGQGNIRLTFLVSDGLYFGEGPFEAMQKDSMGGGLIRAATQLLQAVVALGAK